MRPDLDAGHGVAAGREPTTDHVILPLTCEASMRTGGHLGRNRLMRSTLVTRPSAGEMERDAGCRYVNEDSNSRMGFVALGIRN